MQPKVSAFVYFVVIRTELQQVKPKSLNRLLSLSQTDKSERTVVHRIRLTSQDRLSFPEHLVLLPRRLERRYAELSTVLVNSSIFQIDFGWEPEIQNKNVGVSQQPKFFKRNVNRIHRLSFIASGFDLQSFFIDSGFDRASLFLFRNS